MNAQVKTGLLLGGCALACSAPLIAAPVITLFVAGGMGLFFNSMIGLAACVLVIGGLYAYICRRIRVNAKAAKPENETNSCGCLPASSCEPSNVCDVPEQRSEILQQISIPSAIHATRD